MSKAKKPNLDEEPFDFVSGGVILPSHPQGRSIVNGLFVGGGLHAGVIISDGGKAIIRGSTFNVPHPIVAAGEGTEVTPVRVRAVHPDAVGSGSAGGGSARRAKRRKRRRNR